jgi:hypothetical protein
MDDDDDGDLSGDGRILPGGTTMTTPTTVSTTAPAVGEEFDPPAWAMFIGFVVLCLALILLGRWAIRRCCGAPPSGPPPKPPGKVLAGIRFGSPVPYKNADEIELNLLEPNDAETDDVDVVVDRTAKNK